MSMNSKALHDHDDLQPKKEQGATKKKHLVEQQIAKGDGDNDLQQGEAEEEPSMMWTEDESDAETQRQVARLQELAGHQ
jgi:hypothetical protein